MRTKSAIATFLQAPIKNLMIVFCLHAGLLLVGGLGDAIQLQAGHWALGYRWPLLQMLKENEF